MKKYCGQLIIGAAVMLLTIKPARANTTPITGVKLQSGINEIEQPLQIAQTSEQPIPLITNPEIIIEDSQTSVGQENQQPTIITTPSPLPRAVAPPLGDIAVSNIDSTPEIINLGTAARVPRLLLREAPVEEVLGILARSANLNLIFSDEGKETNRTVTLDLENESVQDIFNSVLLVSGLEANRQGRILYVGYQLPQAARNLMTRTFRLNQASSSAVANVLASHGAAVQQLVTPIIDITDPITNRVVQRRQEPPELRPITVNQPKDSTAPLLLQGLTITTDDRNNSLTMVGSGRQIEIATSFLMQMDVRRRQVAVNVKVIDVNLSNDDRFDASFSFGSGDGFFVSDGGNAFFNYGGVNPPTSSAAASSQFAPSVVPLTVPGAELEPFFDSQDAPFGEINRDTSLSDNQIVPFARPNFGTNDNPFQPGITNIDREDFDLDGDGVIERDEVNAKINTVTFDPPGLFQFPTKFLASLEARIISGNAKILTDPTLVVQEGQEATVKLVQEVIGSINTEIDTESGVRTVTPVIREAGLNLTVNIEKIDDNGFVNFTVSPVVTAPATTQDFSSAGQINQITLLNIRELTSGLIRLRDAQTLILSGIIQETDTTTVAKVPILGDIPLLGALFRSTQRENQRNEVIVLVTPQIIDDSDSSGFGYNYVPGREASQILRQQGVQVPNGSP